MQILLCEISLYEIMVHDSPNMEGKVDKNLAYEIESFFKTHNYFIYTLGRDGIMRVETVHNHPDMRNFLFSVYRTETLFTSYELKEEIHKLLNNT